MSHFIELHRLDDDETPIAINVDWVYCIEPYEKSEGTSIRFGVEQYRGDRNAGTQDIIVRESYFTVKRMLGC